MPGARANSFSDRPLCRLVGSRLGWTRGRASPHRAKSVGSTSHGSLPSTVSTVNSWRSCLVIGALTPNTWLVHITDEVPRCLPPPAGVSTGYKLCVKGLRYAAATGTESYRPRPQGWQQRGSMRSGRKGNPERQNRKQPDQAPTTRIVSHGTQATKWPAGTSLPQPADMLRNIPTGLLLLRSDQAQHGKIVVVGNGPIISPPPTPSAIDAGNPSQIAAGSSGTVLQASSGHNHRPTPHLRSSPERIVDRLGGQAAPERLPPWVAGISTAEGWRSIVRAFRRRPAVRVRCVGGL